MGNLIRVSHGLWRSAASVADLAGRCRALLRALPPGTVVAGATAARLHGLWLPQSSADERVEVILRGAGNVPRELPGSVRGEIRGRRRDLSRADVDLVAGVPLTSEARTWVDLAQQLALPDLVAAGDSVLRGGRTNRAELARSVVAASGRRGVVAARRALTLLDARSRSRPESHLRVALVVDGLPRPEVNRPIFDDHGGWLAEPDLHYGAARLALEYNGSAHAESMRMRRDITRGLDMARAGWLTLTFGPAQVFGRPDDAAALVRLYLDARNPGWRARRPLPPASGDFPR